jgi:hypothetical protein
MAFSSAAGSDNLPLMALLIHLLTSAALMVHAIVGCCGHGGHSKAAGHTHGCMDGCHTVHSHHGHSHGDAPDQSGAADEAPESPHVCEHARCAWHVQESTEIDWLRPSLDWIAFGLEAHVPSRFEARDASELSIRRSIEASALPVRSHLAKCVLVI